jgi:hypothetical protein
VNFGKGLSAVSVRSSFLNGLQTHLKGKQMSNEPNYREERIERLLKELKYEVTRGIMDGEIDESLGFRFIVPGSKQIPNGVVQCEFRMRPLPAYSIPYTDEHYNGAKLRVIK